MTAPFRFVHCSDVHLDSPFRCADDGVRAALAEGNRDAFRRLADLCLSETVDALLIAGDLFDDERLSYGTEEFMVEQVSRLTAAGIHVIAATGNHDPGGEGLRAAGITWPKERFTLLRGPEPQEILVRSGETIVGRVMGTGHASGSEARSLLAKFGTPRGDEPSVALLHAHVEEAEGSGNHPRLAPCTVAELSALGCRYVALGHVHRRQRLGAQAIHYSGTLCGHHAGETGAHGALLVSVPARGEPQVEFRPLAAIRWETIALKGLERMQDAAALRLAAATAFESLRKQPDVLPGQKWMLRVALSGPCAMARDLQEDDLVDELSEELAAEMQPQGALAVAVCDEGVTLPCNLTDHRGQAHLLGLALEVIDALAEDGKLLTHLHAGPLAGMPHGSAEEKRAWLRTLLPDLDLAAAEVLLKETTP
jgi:DNA repair exonuclease SbcCD nuclease subunit